MEQKSNRGGVREGAGRKPTGNVKKPVTFYFGEDVLQKFGGQEGLKKAVIDYVGGSRVDKVIPAVSDEDRKSITAEIETIRNEKCPGFLSPKAHELSKTKRISELYSKLK